MRVRSCVSVIQFAIARRSMDVLVSCVAAKAGAFNGAVVDGITRVAKPPCSCL